MADEIGKAMQKVGGTAGELKVPFEQVSSWIAVVSSDTRQSAETIGDSIKSILARMQSLKEKGFDESDGTQVNQVSKALATVGIQLVDAQGNFRNFGQVMDEIGAKWDTLSGREKSYLATTVAGTYQQSNFLALMNDYGQSTELYKNALDSAGTSQQKFNLYQQSTEASLNRLKDTFDAFWMSIFKSDALQNLINGLNTLLSVTSSLVEHMGVLPTTLGIATTAFLVFNSGLRNTIIEYGIFTNSLAQAGDAIEIGAGKSRVLQNAMYSMTLAARGAGVAVDFLGTSLKSIFAFATTTFLPIAAIMAIGYAIQKVSQAISDYNQQQQQMKQQEQDLVNSYSNHKSKVEDLVKSYDSLSAAQKNGTLSTDQNKQLTDTENQLAKILPSVVAGYDAKGNAILQSSKQIKDQIKLIQQQIDLEKQQKQLQSPKDLYNSTSTQGNLQDQINKQQMVAAGYEKIVKNADKQKLDQSTINYYNELELQVKGKIASLQQQISSEQQKSASTIKNYFDGSKIDTTAVTQITTALSSISLKGKDVNDIQNFFQSTTEDINKLNTALKDGNKNDINNAEKGLKSLGVSGKVLQAIIDALTVSQDKNTQSKKNSALSDATIAKNLQDAKGDYQALLKVVQEYTQAKEYDNAISVAQGEAYSTLAKTLDPVNKMLEDMANGQSLSASSAMDLISQNQDLAKYITITGNEVQINTQGILDWRTAQINSYKDALDAIEKTAQAQTNATLSNLNNYKLEIKAITDLASAQKSLAELKALSASIQGPSELNGKKASDSVDQTIKQVQSIVDIFNNIDNLSKLASQGLTETGTSIDKTSNSIQNSTYVVDKYKNSMDQLTNSLDKLKSLEQQYPNWSQGYRTAIQQEIDLLKQQKELTDAQASSLQQQINSGQIQPVGMVNSTTTTTSSGSNYNYASGNSISAQIWNFLKGKGLSDSAIAGIMGNLQQESSLNPTVNQDGLAQWSDPSRKAAWFQYARDNGTDAYSLSTQLGYLWKEISSGNYGVTPSTLNGMSASQAALYFSNNFERPSSSAANNSGRETYANQFYNQFSGKGGSISTSSVSDVGKSAADAAQAIDQAKSQVLSLQQNSQQIQDQIQSLYLEIVNSNVAAIDRTKNQYEEQITQYDYLQNVYDKNSKQWMDTQVKREQAYQSEVEIEKQSIDYIQQQIQYNTQLNESQKATLSDEVLQRQSDLVSLEQKLYDTRNQMATQIVDTYKQALTAMKDAATKSIDNMINDINNQANKADYQKKLSTAQKSAQDIQDQINKLMLDDSASAKKQVADLQKQLSTQNDSIDQMVSDNDKQSRIDNLNNQKQIVSDYYDNMLNDEQKFSDMRTSILNLSNQNIIDDLNKFSTTIQQNFKLLGTSVVNNLISLINQANSYMGQSKQLPLITAAFDTGGMTSSWGSEGKLAMLHEKEMVLNKFDTSNLLKIVDITRNLVNNFKIPNFSNLQFTPNAATACGNTYSVNIAKVEVTGDSNGAKQLLSEFVNGVKRLGGKFN